MGMPGDVATHMVGSGFTAPYPKRCADVRCDTHKMYGNHKFLGDRSEMW